MSILVRELHLIFGQNITEFFPEKSLQNVDEFLKRIEVLPLQENENVIPPQSIFGKRKVNEHFVICIFHAAKVLDVGRVLMKYQVFHL